MIKKILKNLMVVILLLAIILQPIMIYAADAANYTSGNIDYNDYYSDYHESGYANMCKYVSISPSVTFVDSSGNGVSTTTSGDKVYVPSGTRVKLAWNLSGASGFASTKLNIWQKDKDLNFDTVTSYNGGGSGIFYLRGKASGLIGNVIASKTSGKWTQIYSIEEYNKINFLCASDMLLGEDGESDAVGSPTTCMGNTTQFYYYEDKIIIGEDNNPPTVSVSLSSNPSNGWYAPGTTVTFTANDAESDISSLIVNGATRDNPFTTSLSGGINNFTYLAIDNAGNSSGDNQLSVNVDSTAPSLNAFFSTQSKNGWYAPGTTVSFSTSDSESGVANLIVDGASRANPYSQTLNNGGNNIKYAANDNVGNGTGDNFLNVNVDATAPSVSATPSQSTTANGWYKGTTTLTFSASDSESGLKTLKVDGSTFTSGNNVDIPEGTNTYTYEGIDNAENSSGEKSISLSVDKSAPTTSIAGAASTWTNKDVALTIIGNDGNSGLNKMTVEYSSDNNNWSIYDTKSYSNSTSVKTATIMASKNGYYRVKAIDAVGYEKTSSQTIVINKIDKEKPTIIANVTGDEGNPVDKWYKKSAKIKIVAADTGVSGLKQIIYNGMSTTNNSIELPTISEDVNKYVYRADDNAGNTTGNFQTDIYVDASKPTDLSWTSNQNAWTNQDIIVTMKAKDIYSGLKKFEVQKKSETTKEWEYYAETLAAYATVLTTKEAPIKENGTYRFKAIDRVGYEEIVGSTIIIEKIDKEKPVVTPTEIGSKSSNGWFKDSVNLKLVAEDFGVSGLKTMTSKVGITSSQTDMPNTQMMKFTRTEIIDDEGTTTATYSADDWAGNTSGTRTSMLKVDKTKPKDVTIAADTSTWTNTSVAVTAKATDMMSGLAKIIVQKDIDAGAAYDWQDYLVKDYKGESTEQTNIFAIEENGTYRIKAVDMVGFEMTSDLSMKDSGITDPSNPDEPGIIIITKIDKIKPLIEATIYGGDSYSLTSGGWYKDDVRLKLTATDEASGVGTITCNGNSSAYADKSKTYEEEYAPFQNGVNHFEYFATDVAGNNSEIGTTELKIDLTKPVTSTFTKLTTDWVTSETGVIFECTGQDMESGLLKFVLERSENGIDGWSDGPTYTYLGETTLETVNMVVKQNGYYRLAVYDRVQNITYSGDVIYVENIDDTLPEGASLGITPNTEEWVNEVTGVDLTATGQDINSGIDNLYVYGKTDSSEFEKISGESFNGETSILETEYQTHLNGYYKTGAQDRVGNYKEMKDEEALEVPNIDPINPTVIVEVDSTQWASLESGYEIYAYARDSESGLNSIQLQTLNEAGEWEDTGIDFEKQSYIQNEEKLSTYEGNFANNLLNKAILAVNKQFFGNSTAVSSDKAVSGTNEMIKVLFKVAKNGTYRVLTDDIVANATGSSEVVVTTMDFDSPNLMVEGNPTEWTNQTATIKVTGKDDSSGITKMTLNGEEVKFKTVNDAYFFMFEVEKNATYQVAAIDKAGHSTSQTVYVTKIDKEFPFVNAELGEWVEGVVNAKVNVGDSLSGVKCAYINDTMIEVADVYQTTLDTKLKAEVTYLVTITDNAGNMITKQVSENKRLDYIKVTTPPDKTSYNAKENFDKKGMVVTAYYTDNTNQIVTEYTILDGENLAAEQNKVNVSYTERGITKKDNTDISVSIIPLVLDYIKITTPPNKTSYKVKESFDKIGMVVTAYYTDGSNKVVEDYTILNGIELKVEQKQIQVSYTEGAITKTDNTGIRVSIIPLVLDYIKITTPPNKTSYKVKESFDKKGMVVTAYYTDGSSKVVEDYTVLDGQGLEIKRKKIQISYTEGDITKMDNAGIQVSEETKRDPTPDPTPDPIPTPEPSKPITPTPITPKPTPVTPTPEEIREVVEEPEMIKETPKKETVLAQETVIGSKVKSDFPVMAVVGATAGAGMFLIFLFFMLANVRVYSMKEDGKYKLIGRTRVRKKEAFYYVKTNPIMILNAASGDFKFVFSKGFVKTHFDINVVLRIEDREYNRHLAEGENTIYVEFGV